MIFETLFYQPILNLVIFLYNNIPGHDLAVSIIVLTIIIKVLLLPLSKKSIKSQKALQELQPKIEEIKQKYKDNKEAQTKAMMEMYKNNKVNPFSSCLPLLIQLPFLIAVFQVFRHNLNESAPALVYSFITFSEVDYTTIGGFDLAAKSTVMAVLSGAAQFWQTKMMMTKKPEIKSPGSKDENMMAMMNKQMMYVMPVMTVFIAMGFPSGLALYWLTTTILTVAQQYYVIGFKKDKDGGDKKNDSGTKVIEGEVV